MVVVGHQAVGDRAQLQGRQVVLDLAQHKQVIFGFLEDRNLMRAAVVEVVVMARKAGWASWFQYPLFRIEG
jgi:hypothetical protein